MSSKLASNLDSLLPDLVVDKSFYNKILEFNYKWASKNDDHIKFLGGNTIGVEVIRFSQLDDKIFYDMLDVDIKQLTSVIYNTPGIEKTRQVSSNPHYVFLMYLIYKTINTTKLNNKEKNELIQQLYYTFAYRVISGRMVHYFKYPLDEDIAKTVSERLSNKFILKKMGSWNKMLEYRTKDVLPGGLHYKSLSILDAVKTQKSIADLFIRLKEVFKNIYPIIIEVKESNNIIKSTSLIESKGEDGPGFKDSVYNSSIFIVYLKSILTRPSDLILPDLVSLVRLRIGIISNDDLIKGLSNLDKINDKELNLLVDKLIPTVLDFLYRKGITGNYIKNVLNIVNLLKGYAITHTVKDEAILIARDLFTDYIKKLFGSNERKDVVQAMLAGLIVYIAVRPLYKKY